MIALDFNISEPHTNLDIHKISDTELAFVAHNGFSYTRIVYPIAEIERLTEILKNKANNEAESI